MRTLIEQLLAAREQLDNTIERLNITPPKGDVSDSTGILLVFPKGAPDSDYFLVVFGRDNYLACHAALRTKRLNEPD